MRAAWEFALLGHPQPPSRAAQDDQLRRFAERHGPLGSLPVVVADFISADDDPLPDNYGWGSMAETLSDWRSISFEAWQVLGLLHLGRAIDVRRSLVSRHLQYWRAGAATLPQPGTLAELVPPTWTRVEGRRPRSDNRRRVWAAWVSRILNANLKGVAMQTSGDTLPLRFDHAVTTLGQSIWIELARFACDRTLVGACAHCGAPIFYRGSIAPGFRRGLHVKSDGPTARAMYCDNGGRCKQAAYRARCAAVSVRAARRKRDVSS